MQNRSRFLTFLSALIPGVGYMYLGLIKKGIQTMVIFFLVEPLFSFIGLDGLTSVITIPLWFYLFFDTFNIASKLDRGENVPDTDFIFNENKNIYNSDYSNDTIKNIGAKRGLILGWALVIIGILAIINKIFPDNEIYNFIEQSIGTYFVPVIFVFVGVYLLVKKK